MYPAACPPAREKPLPVAPSLLLKRVDIKGVKRVMVRVLVVRVVRSIVGVVMRLVAVVVGFRWGKKGEEWKYYSTCAA